MSAHHIAIAGTAKAVLELDVAPFGPTQLLQRLSQHRIAGLKVRVGFEGARNHADAPHPVLLRACRKRPRRRSAADERDEIPPSDVDCHATPPAGGRVHAIEGRYHALAKERIFLLRCESLEPPMSQSGQTRPWRHVRVESVLPPTSAVASCHKRL